MGSENVEWAVIRKETVLFRVHCGFSQENRQRSRSELRGLSHLGGHGRLQNQRHLARYGRRYR